MTNERTEPVDGRSSGNPTPDELNWPIVTPVYRTRSSRNGRSAPAGVANLPTLADFLAQELADLLARTPPAERPAVVERFRAVLAQAAA